MVMTWYTLGCTSSSAPMSVPTSADLTFSAPVLLLKRVPVVHGMVVRVCGFRSVSKMAHTGTFTRWPCGLRSGAGMHGDE
jgi:hypothetical protein